MLFVEFRVYVSGIKIRKSLGANIPYLFVKNTNKYFMFETCY